MCGREFMRNLCMPPDLKDATGLKVGASPQRGSELFDVVKQRRARGGGAVHVAMNLPNSALEFLDTFKNLFDRAAWDGPLPTVHCYCFSKAKDEAAFADVRTRAAEVLGASLEGRSEVRVVRDVAPGKLMLCISFVVPDEVGWRHSPNELPTAAVVEGAAVVVEEALPAKRARVDGGGEF
mmetsp:Transcript_30364/g.74811  ORF Transcript_30364/g.74811 Transcript_30364/m.74811 type:complete len:180 (-) Transcript_30364:54-593(-)